MKKRAMRALSSALAASMVLANGIPAYAAGGSGTSQSVPVNITTEALTYNVTVSEALLFDFGQGITDEASISVTNNSPVGVVEITGIENTGMENGFKLKSVRDESYWKKLPLDSKQFALRYDGESAHDFSLGALEGELKDVDPTTSETLDFSAWTGGVSEDQDNIKINSLGPDHGI